MSAPLNNKNAVGNKGGGSTCLQKRELNTKLRGLVVEKCIKIIEQPEIKMTKEDYDFYKLLLLKLAGTVLPRINEVGGEDGGPIKVYLWNNYEGGKSLHTKKMDKTTPRKSEAVESNSGSQKSGQDNGVS